MIIGVISQTNFCLVSAPRTRKRGRKDQLEDALWTDENFKKMKLELMSAQLDEIRSRTELNKAQPREIERKSEFWDRAISGLANNSVVLEVRNSSELVFY